MKLYQAIASAVVARLNCIESGNVEWKTNHEARIEKLVKDHMPCGAGFDCGTKFDYNMSGKDELVFWADYHHMDESGMYDGWSTYKVVVRPSFDGIDLTIKGRNKNDIKDYIHDTFYWSLNEEVKQ